MIVPVMSASPRARPASNHESLAEEIAKEEKRLRHLEAEKEDVEARLRKLRAEFAALGAGPVLSLEVPVLSASPIPRTPLEKVTVFRSLFRGRSDVYPKLWVNAKTGKKGYSPACRNEWVRGVCEKPRVKCGE